MKANKTITCLVFLMCLMGCGNNNNNNEEPVPGGVEPVEDNLSMRFSFEEEDNSIVESVNNKTSQANYIFSNAAYKSSEYVNRFPGISGNALSFDGNSVYFESDPIAFPSDGFAFSIYVAPRAFERNPGQYTSIFTNLSSVGGIELAMSNFGYWKIIVGTNKGQLQSIVTKNPLQLYKWNHICVNYSKKSAKLDLFYNGEVAGTLELGDRTINSSNEKVLVGKSVICTEDNGFELNHFNGLLDEICIYKKALTNNEISFLANKAINTETNKDNGMWFSYKTLADDRYAPQYHMRNPLGWANEHYGGFFYNGKYHIFSQHNPFRGSYQNGQRWGHLTSTDLVHWEVQYPALTPEDNRIDNDNCFSGSTIIKPDGTPMLAYTGLSDNTEYFVSISTAQPTDLKDPNLVNWTKSNTRIIDTHPQATKWEFRDSFIYEENGQYFILVGGDNVSGNGAAYIYKATDNTLTTWQSLGICYSGDSSEYPVLGTMYELPCLFKLSNKDKTISKYMLMISPIRTINGVYYWLGDFNLETGKFTPEDPYPQRIDLGPTSQTLAASGFVDKNTGRVLFTSMARTKKSAADEKLSGWDMCQTLWKELYLSDSGELRFTPIIEYKSLEGQKLLEMTDVNMTVPQMNNVLSTIRGDQLKIEIEIDPNGDSACGLSVKSGSIGEMVSTYYDYNAGTFNVDNTRGSFDNKTSGSGSGHCNPSGSTLKMTIYVDRSMVESYFEDINEITVYAFNTYQDSNSLKMYSKQSKAIVKNIVITKLNDAYGQNKEAYWGE